MYELRERVDWELQHGRLEQREGERTAGLNVGRRFPGHRVYDAAAGHWRLSAGVTIAMIRSTLVPRFAAPGCFHRYPCACSAAK